MRALVLLGLVAGVVCGAGSLTTPASAGSAAYLSRTGSGNACSLALPCASMPSAVSAAGANGEVICCLVHGLIYRWPATRLSDEQVERAVEWIVLPVYQPVERWLARLRGPHAS